MAIDAADAFLGMESRQSSRGRRVGLLDEGGFRLSVAGGAKSVLVLEVDRISHPSCGTDDPQTQEDQDGREERGAMQMPG